MKKALFIWVIGALGVAAGGAWASTPAGFSSVSITLTARVSTACQEAQRGFFPTPITIDSQAAVDQTFTASTDEKVVCTNGTVFTVKVSSGNGTAVDQVCTSSGISSMAMKSSEAPTDAIAYTFLCSGDTDGLGHFTGAGYATPRALGMGVKILASAAQAAVAHADYSDTIMLTISY